MTEIIERTENESLCYSCQMYDRVRGCYALEDTYFPKYPCPFYKSIHLPHEEPVFTGSHCARCFAGLSDGSCRALTKKPPAGHCPFFKTPERLAAENEKNKERLNAYLKRYPEALDKYITLKG